jgi:phenylalanyl-tRNA synthetase beta chain
MLPAPEGERGASELRAQLIARDWQEVITFSFVAASDERAIDPDARPITVLNPIAEHLEAMRTTLLPGLLATLRTNVKRRMPRVRVFEIGRVFLRDGFGQPMRVGGLAFGPAAPEQWSLPLRSVDFFDVKGDLEALVLPLALTTRTAARPWLHPGRAADVVIDGTKAGWIGELHPQLVRHFELASPPVVFELDVDALRDIPMPQARAMSRLPSIRRDMAIIVSENLPVGEILQSLQELESPAIEAIDVFDVYRGPELPNGMKSVAILVLMRDTQRTLTDEDSERIVTELLASLRNRFGATLRS